MTKTGRKHEYSYTSIKRYDLFIVKVTMFPDFPR